MPHKPPTRCTKPGCRNYATNRGRCDKHTSSGWTDRPRPQDKRTTTQRLGITDTQWDEIRVTILARDHGICHICGHPEADQVDHIQPIALGGARTDPNNLAAIHQEPCHRRKTARELAEMRRQARQRTRPRE